VSEGECNEGEAALEALEREIDEETETIADFRQRTRTLEIEIAGWKPEPQPPRPPRGASVGQAEALLGMLLGAISTAIVGKLLSLLFERQG
jgi:hypothetical protein